MKLLSYNIGYCLGYRSHWDWVRRPHRAIRASARAERDVLEQFLALAAEEPIDVCAIQEVDQGSFRTSLGDQAQTIARGLGEDRDSFDYEAACKYGPNRLVSKLPGFRKMSNMIAWRSEAGSARSTYIDPGFKQVVQILEHDGPTVVAVHLPTTPDTRAAQVQALASLVADMDSVVVVGDFNLFGGLDELSPLTEELGYAVHAPGDTYPTANPSNAFDLVLASPGVSVEECRIHGDLRCSDHLPISATIAE